MSPTQQLSKKAIFRGTLKEDMTLSELTPGLSCKIKKIKLRGMVGQRLLDMGLFPGTIVSIVRNAPLIDPVELKIDNQYLSIRHLEARAIEVDLL